MLLHTLVKLITIISAALTVTLFSALAYGQTPGTYSVLDFGADPTGVADSAPAFTHAIASNRKIIVPPGTYLFKSTVQPPSCGARLVCAVDRPAVLVQNARNFSISGYGATINVDPSIAFSTAFLFLKAENFQIEGLTINGSRAGLVTKQVNVGISLFSAVDWTVRDINFASGFGDNGAALSGSWLVNGRVLNNRMLGVGQCADFAFAMDLEIRGNFALGGGPSGVAGQKCLSFFFDGPNAATNNTGYAITQPDGVRIESNYVKNFANGLVIATGSHYKISGNVWDSNPGVAPNALGTGILIYYVNGGRFSSIGFPPSNIVIDGDSFLNNGTTVNGAGLLIDTNNITNSDLIQNVTIANSLFENNRTIGIYTSVAAHASNFVVYGNSFSGPNQQISIDRNTFSFMPFVAQATSPSVNFASGQATQMTSLTLPPGQWSVTAQILFSGAAPTTVASLWGGVSTTSASIPSTIGAFASWPGNGGTPFANSPVTQFVGPVIYQLSGPTTVFCNGLGNFSVSTATGYCSLVAQRTP